MKKRKYFVSENSRPIYHRILTGLFPLGSALLVFSFWLFGLKVDLGTFGYVMLAVSILFITVGLICIFMFFSEKNIPRFNLPKMSYRARRIARKIERLFDEMTIVDILRITPKTKYGYPVPVIKAFIAENCLEGYVLIENLGAYERVGKATLSESISGVMKGNRLAGYEVVRSDLELGGMCMRFDFENVKGLTRLEVKHHDLTPFKSDSSHDIKLGNDLIWHARKYPMMSLIARTGAGKSVLAGYIADIATLQGWEVRYSSAKRDKYVERFNGSYEVEDIVELAEKYVHVMTERLSVVAEASRDDYADVGLNDILLVFDELGHLNALLSDDKKLNKRWQSALKSLSMTGRSAGIHLLLISQFGTIEGFVNSSIRAQVSDVVIMLGNAASSASERQYVMGGYADIPSRFYGIGEGLALVSGAGRKWEEPHYYQAPWIDD